MKINKSTDELMKVLENSDSIEEYLNDNENDLTNVTLEEFLADMLNKYNVTKTDAIKKSLLDDTYAYQIFSPKIKKKPSRNKIIQIAFGIGLDLDDTQKLLRTAGHNALYPRREWDSAVIYAINRKFTAEECDELLYDIGQDTLTKAD